MIHLKSIKSRICVLKLRSQPPYLLIFLLKTLLVKSVLVSSLRLQIFIFLAEPRRPLFLLTELSFQPFILFQKLKVHLLGDKIRLDGRMGVNRLVAIRNALSLKLLLTLTS